MATLAADRPDPPHLYARFSRRFRALAIDSAVYGTSLVALLLLIEGVGGRRAATGTAVFAWIAFLCLYEPLLVWRRGATLGHALTNLRVVDLRSGGNPGFLKSLGRFWLKSLVGLAAFAFMGTTRRHQALHDLAAGTTVELRDPDRARPEHFVGARADLPAEGLPPAWRRIAVIVVYVVGSWLLLGLVLVGLESDACVQNPGACTGTERAMDAAMGLLCVGSLALCIVLGWRGRLPGARRKRGPAPESAATSSNGTVGKRSWPLLLLAACAFLPGIGLFFAAAAVTWGLVSDRPRARLAVGLGGAGGLLNLIGSVLLVWSISDNPRFAASNAASAKRDLTKLVAAIEDYRKTEGVYPPDLTVFTRLPLSLKLVNVQDFSAGVFHRPRMYQYRRSSDGRAYDVYGVGMDGKPGTGDDVRLNLPDSTGVED
jgi:uncharacterized RDD family membrane protein YckC